MANYIIICRGRIDFEAAHEPVEKIAALSRVAADLVAHVDVMNHGALANEDTQPISTLQHYLMINLQSLSPQQVESKGAEMFALLHGLEKKFA